MEAEAKMGLIMTYASPSSVFYSPTYVKITCYTIPYSTQLFPNSGKCSQRRTVIWIRAEQKNYIIMISKSWFVTFRKWLNHFIFPWEADSSMKKKREGHSNFRKQWWLPSGFGYLSDYASNSKRSFSTCQSNAIRVPSGCLQVTSHHKAEEKVGVKCHCSQDCRLVYSERRKRPWNRSQFCVWQPSYLPLSPMDNSIAKGTMKVPTKNC